MRKRIRHIVTALVTVGFVSIIGVMTNRLNCLDPAVWAAMGFDPNETSVSISAEECDARLAMAVQNHPELFVGGGSASPQSAVPSNNSQPSTYQNSSGKKESKSEKNAPKENVYFTDMMGKVIGTSQVTFGTTIDTRQFPQKIEDIEHNGKTYQFDKWTYENQIIEHDYIVRAEYKEKQ